MVRKITTTLLVISLLPFLATLIFQKGSNIFCLILVILNSGIIFLNYKYPLNKIIFGLAILGLAMNILLVIMLILFLKGLKIQMAG